MECLCGERITLQFANKIDKKLIYQMLISPDVINLMFDEDHPAPSWEEFNEDEPEEYFSGSLNDVGNYLLIKVNQETIGTISFSICKGKLKAAELDIWISSTSYLGKGYGVEAIKLLIQFINSTFGIKTFIIRPWLKNTNAIKAYKKCGFKELENFAPADFYSEDFLALYGEGDYGIEETANLIYEIRADKR